MPENLSPQLISLVHHVELNKSGWMDETIRQLILWKLAELDQPAELETIVQLLHSEATHEIGSQRIEKQLEALTKSFDIASVDGRFKVSEINRGRMRNALDAAETLVERVKRVFDAIFSDLDLSVDRDEFWDRFLSLYLNPLLGQFGAATFDLFAGNQVSFDLPRFELFLEVFPSNEHEKIQDGIETFFKSGDDDVRKFILGSLNAIYFREASSLSEDTINSLRKNPGEQVEFIVYADTNFLLALLGFKDGLDNVASTINDFVGKLKGRVKVSFRILQPTLKEAINVLSRKREKLGRINLQPSQYSGLYMQDFDDIDLRFLDKHRQTGISADDYFSPYTDDLILCLSDRNIVFDNADISKYPSRQDVIDDIMFVQDWEKENKIDPAKSYEQIEHDIILWHYVNDRRPLHLQSPTQAKHWVLTFDSKLRAFDSQKKHLGALKVQVCLHPGTFIQILQFWIPRSKEFEDAILSSLRIPLLAQEFDGRAEHVTLEILGALSRFESVGDLKVHTINEILTNKALREKISAKRDRDETFKLVRDALIEKHALTEKELERTRKEVERIDQERAALQNALQDVEKEKLDAVSALEDTRNELAKERQEKEVSTQRRRFARNYVFLPFAILVFFEIVLYLLLPDSIPFGRRFWLITIAAAYFGILIWLIGHDGKSKSEINGTSLFKTFEKLRAIAIIAIAILWGVLNFIANDDDKRTLRNRIFGPQSEQSEGPRE